MLTLPRFIGKALARFLATPRPGAQTGTPTDPRKLLHSLQPWVRDSLLQYYERVDVFTAPRKPSIQAWVEVYVRRK